MRQHTPWNNAAFSVPASVAIWATCAFAQVAQAQTTGPGGITTVEITGSRLKRTDTATPSPVDIVTRADIARSGKTTQSDVVRSLTVDNNGSIGLGNVSGFAMGSSGVSLRGLAVNATLVLVNGRRMVHFGLADDVQRTFVNLSAIPLDLVDRIEVLKEGASAIYGSDAIAGVVNIILRSQYQGASADLGYGWTEGGGGATPHASLTGGIGNLDTDGYNLFANLEVSHQQGIPSADRAGRKWIGNGDLRPYGYDFTAGGIGPNIGGWFDNAGGTSNPNRYGAVSPAAGPVAWRQLPGCTSAIRLPAGLGGCPYDRVRDYGAVLPEERKVNLYVRGTMRLSRTFEPYFELGRFGSDTRSTWVFGPTGANELWIDPATNAVKDNTRLPLPAAHPDNPLGADGLLSYLTADAGPRSFEHDSAVWRALAGARGEWAGWRYDTGLLYGHTTTTRILRGFIRDSVLKAGLAGTGPFGYYRLGANAGLNPPAFYQALSPEISTDNVATLTMLDFKASRDLMPLAGGPLALSVGAEYRRESLHAPAPPYTDIGDIVGWPYYVYSGKQRVLSAFAETHAPVSETLELDGAVRVDKVWNSETSVTPKLGVKWKLSNQLALRGTYTEGFRAPNEVEQGAGNTNAAALDLLGHGFLSVVRTIGNPDLKPEKSRTLTLGAIYEPRRATSLGVTYWWLERSDEINGADPYAILADSAAFKGASVVRDAQGNVLEVSAPFQNNSRSRLQGVDVDVNHRRRLGRFGTLSARLAWTYLDYYKKQFAGGPTVDYAGTHGPMVVSGNTGTPKQRVNAELSWERGPDRLSTSLAYIGSYLNKDNQTAPCFNRFADGAPAPAGCRVASFTTVGLHGSHRVDKHTEIYVSISNVFDRIAPLDPSAYINLNFNPSFHLSGAIGRTFDVGVRHDF
ncbi:TonB-dependent receptor [Massilia putida]|uniref:TonB-dependent receptor n=1 Tax=Massilia putida TaxID=1141883 RepID=UPI000A8F544C|nr:TonB-dependent receptor [Massilia putida]